MNISVWQKRLTLFAIFFLAQTVFVDCFSRWPPFLCKALIIISAFCGADFWGGPIYCAEIVLHCVKKVLDAQKKSLKSKIGPLKMSA